MTDKLPPRSEKSTRLGTPDDWVYPLSYSCLARVNARQVVYLESGGRAADEGIFALHFGASDQQSMFHPRFQV